jgi:phage protein D
MPLDSNIGLDSARPKLFVGGEENTSLVGGLNDLLIIEKSDGLYRCEATFGNWGPINNSTDFLYFDRQILDFGKDFQVKLNNDELFKGKITALEANFPEGKSPTVTVLAEDALQNLRMTRRTRSFEDLSDQDVFSRIAQDHGLSPSISVSGASHKIVAQVNQSDLAFLRERARSLGAEIWIKDNVLNVKTRTNRNGEKVILKYGAQLREFRVIADLANQRTSVTASGWDVGAKESIKKEAADSSISSELGSDASGISILRNAFGERKDSLVHSVSLIGEDAQNAADNFMRTIARQFVVGRGTAEPNAKLRVGSFVELDGVGKLFNGKYYVAEIAHIFDNSKGFRTEFKGERTGIGQ